MTGKDLINAYVTDVAELLPRGQRNDVAFELRALLHEDLAARAEAAGRDADAAMATELVRAFGRPAEVAARYRPTLTIIDPADGRSFLRATVIGLALIWGAGLWVHLIKPVLSGSDFLQALARWWLGDVSPSLGGPGVWVVGYGRAAWARRRRPLASEWEPRAEKTGGGRVALGLGIVGIFCGSALLLDPRWLLDFFWGGRAAPVAYQALTYTETFLGRQAPWLFGLLLLYVPLYLSVLVKGRWSPLLRRFEDAQSLAICAMMVWTVVDGPVLMTPSSDQTAKTCLVLLTAMTLVYWGIRLYRSVRPSPNPSLQAL